MDSRIENAIKSIEEQYTSESNLTLGIDIIDDNFGAIKKNHFVIISGEPASGKSMLCSNIFGKLIQDCKNVIYVSLEMSFDVVYSRLASQMALLDTDYYKGSCDTEESRIINHKFGEHLSQLNNWEILCSNDLKDGTIGDILDCCLEVKKVKHWDKIDLIIIDYLQFVSKDTNVDGIYEHTTQVSKAIKNFVMKNNVPVLGISSLSKNGTLEGANNMLHTCELALLITNDSKDKNIKHLDIIKNRFGNYEKTKFIFDEHLGILFNPKKKK